MHKSSSRWLWATFLIFIVSGLAGCENVISLPAATSTLAPEPTVTTTVVPTAIPELPEGQTPPVLLDYEPHAGQEISAATGAEPAAIKLYFDQPMDQASVVAALRVMPSLEGEYEWPDEATLVFRPRALAASTRYRVTLSGDVRAAAGLPLSTEFSFAFSTLAPLAVTRVLPPAGSADARIDAPAVIVFNRAVVSLACVGEPAQVNSECPALSLNFTPAVLGTGMWVETSVYRFDALRGWAAGRAYTATLAADVISLEGAALRDPVSWSFNTAPPAIQTSIPAAGQSQTPLETDIRVIFNTPMDQEITGSVFSVTDAAGDVVPGTITWEDNGAVLLFTPVTRLRLGTRYTVQVGARARAATSAPLQNPQAWTFTTVPHLALVTFIPQDGATGMDVAEPVRLAFSGSLDTAILERQVVISPAVESPYTYFDAAANIYYLSWDKQPQTEYCVLLKPGTADIYGNVITQTHSSCFVTGDLPAFIGPANAERAVTLDAAQPSELLFLVQNLERVDFVLSEVSEPEFVRGRDVEGAVIREWRETFRTPRNVATVAPLTLRRLGGALPTGYYHLAWENPPWGTQSLNFAVVDRHLTLKLAAEEALVWVTDLRSGEPITRTAVRLVDHEGVLIAAGTTDADGLASIPVSPREDLWQNVAAIVGEPGATGFGVALTAWLGEAAPSAFGIAFDGSVADTYALRLYTDRTVYAPDALLRYRGILREDDGRYLLPSLDLPVQVMLREAGGRGVYTTTAALLDMGTFSGALALPESLGVGDYVLEASLPDAGVSRSAKATFTVAASRDTALTVGIMPASTSIVSGDVLSAVIAVDNVSGIPVAGAHLTWTVYAQSVSLPDVSSGAWQWPEAVSGDPVLVAAGEAVAGAGGRFALELPAKMPVLAAGRSPGPQRWTIEVVACAATTSGGCAAPVNGQAQIVVHSSEFYLGMQPREWVVRGGSRTEVNLLVRDRAQQPLAEKEATVSLTLREWYRLAGEDGVTWSYTDTVISTARVTTNLEGTATATLVPPRSGAYIVAADALDADNRPVHAEIVLWASGPDAIAWPAAVDQVIPVANKHIYHAGDHAKVLLPVAFDGPYQMLMTIERDGILDVERQVLDTPNPVVEIPIIETYAPNVYVSFTLVHGVTETASAPEVRAGYVTLNVAPTAQTLVVTAEADKEAYQPGDTVTMTVRVADAVGRPASAEVSVVLVDKALLSGGEGEDSPAVLSLVEAFYGVRPLQVMTGDGLLVLSGRGASALDVETAYRIPPVGDDAVASRSASGARFVNVALWEGDRYTEANGETQLVFRLPATPATWVAVIYALTAETKVGETQREIVAAQPLRVEPVSPSFLAVGDQAEIAALVYNTADKPFSGAVQLTAGTGARVDVLIRLFDLPAGERTRVAWTLSVAESSAETLPLTFSATGGGYADVVSVEVPLRRYVMPDVMGTAGALDEEGVRLESVVVPPEAGDASALIVRVAPSPIGALVDTLAYLDQQPNAPTDVQIERFASYVFIYRALQELDIADAALLARLEVSLNQALERLYARQNVDGSWRWWEGREARENSAGEALTRDDFTLHLTTFATLGLVKAERAGFDVRLLVKEQALTYIYDNLVLTLEGETRYPHQALGLYVLSDAGIPWPAGAGASLYAARESLGVVGRAYLALALGTSDPSDSRMLALLDGLRSSVTVSAAGAHWEGAGDTALTDGSGYWNTDVVVTGIAVDTLARFAPEDPLLPQAARWLMVTQRGGRWQTPYETAWAIAGMSDVLRASGVLEPARDAPRYDWSVALNGEVLTESATQIGGDDTIVVVPWRLRAGLSSGSDGGRDSLPALWRDRANLLEISRDGGPGVLYYTAHLELSVPVTEVGADSRGLMLRREYCVAASDVAVHEGAAPGACRPLTELRVGEQAAVRLTLSAPQTRAYVRLEVPHPAGFLPVDVAAGEGGDCALWQSASAAWWVTPFERCEVLDDRVIFFASEAPAGTYQMTYVLRAVTPGTYGALPAVASEVYFPEVWGRTAGDVLHILPRIQD